MDLEAPRHPKVTEEGRHAAGGGACLLSDTAASQRQRCPDGPHSPLPGDVQDCSTPCQVKSTDR